MLETAAISSPAVAAQWWRRLSGVQSEHQFEGYERQSLSGYKTIDPLGEFRESRPVKCPVSSSYADEIVLLMHSSQTLDRSAHLLALPLQSLPVNYSMLMFLI